MTFYVDTSVLVAALTLEIPTLRVQSWLSQQPSDTLLSSEWVGTEFSAALSIKLRTGNINASYRDEVLKKFERLSLDTFVVVPIVTSHFRTAARFANRYATGLRASDALHLAVASEQGATIVTLDKKLALAATALGVAAHLP